MSDMHIFICLIIFILVVVTTSIIVYIVLKRKTKDRKLIKTQITSNNSINEIKTMKNKKTIRYFMLAISIIAFILFGVLNDVNIPKTVNTILALLVVIPLVIFFVMLGKEKKQNKVAAELSSKNIVQSILQQHNFVTTNEIGFEKSKILIDTNSKQWSIQDNLDNNLTVREVRKLADILSFEIVDNSTTVYKTRVEGGIARAIIGGAMFGGVGAIVGANTASSSTSTQTNNAYKVLFTVNDINNPIVEFDCFSDFGVAQKIVSTFEVIKYNN